MRVVAVIVALLMPIYANAGCWKVKPNGTQLTRPAYTIKDGALVKSASRAWVGTQCDLKQPTKPSNKDLYASYDSTDKLALCSKR